ncbi:MAG: hypothetical protein KBC26_01925 [Candidatus Pacebacteria bacterium]|nr:hypothetical protein [Candidatus Paceibacterota bacterium]
MKWSNAVVILGAMWLLVVTTHTYAAQPHFIVTWHANNNAPLWFEGKHIPSDQATVTASIEAISQNPQDKGKFIDLKKSEVRWYVNDSLLEKGVGKKSIEIPGTLFRGLDLEVQVEFNYQDAQTQNASFVRTFFKIPLGEPELVLETKTRIIKNTSPVAIRVNAFPFFFNTKNADLAMRWAINSTKVTTNENAPFALEVGIKEPIIGQGIKVTANAQSRTDELEQASRAVNFRIEQ